MKVVFLCGGVGKRMFPITEDKFLLDFLGKTLLEHQARLALHAGINDFVIIGNPGNLDNIKKISSAIKGADFKYELQSQPLGIADALKCAAQFLDSEIIVVNPNDVFDASAYTCLLNEYREGKASSYMLGYEVKQYFPGGYLAVNNQGELIRIEEKPEPGTEPGNLVNILLHIHTEPRRLLDYIDRVKTTRDDVYERAMDDMLRDGYKIKVTRYDGAWAPIKYPWHIFDIVRHFLDGGDSYIAPSASIANNATVAGKVYIGENVRVLENAIIRGPAYIGAGSIIGNNALVRDYCHIGCNCVIGFSTEVKTSYIGDNCWFHSNYIGDSIVGNNCSFGAGTVTANFRFDEKDIQVRYAETGVATGLTKLGAIIGDNCKTGINSGILPGRRVGPNSIIGAHVLLANDLEPDTMILSQTDCRIIKNDIVPDSSDKQERKEKLENK